MERKSKTKQTNTTVFFEEMISDEFSMQHYSKICINHIQLLRIDGKQKQESQYTPIDDLIYSWVPPQEQDLVEYDVDEVVPSTQIIEQEEAAKIEGIEKRVQQVISEITQFEEATFSQDFIKLNIETSISIVGEAMKDYHITYDRLGQLRKAYFDHVSSIEVYKKKIQYLFIRFKNVLLFPVNKIPNKSDNRFNNMLFTEISKFVENPDHVAYLEYLQLNWLDIFMALPWKYNIFRDVKEPKNKFYKNNGSALVKIMSHFEEQRSNSDVPTESYLCFVCHNLRIKCIAAKHMLIEEKGTLLSRDDQKATVQGWITKVKNGHAKKCWGVLLGRMFLYFKAPGENVSEISIILNTHEQIEFKFFS